MKQLSPAEMAVLRAWYDYLRTHKPRLHCADESQNDCIDRRRLFYLMTEIMFAYYNAMDVHWAAYQVCRMMQVDSGTWSRWRQKWQKLWLDVHLD